MQGEGGIASLQGLFFPSAQELRDRLCNGEHAGPPACAPTKQQQSQQGSKRRGRGKAKGKRRGRKNLRYGDAEGEHIKRIQQGNASESAHKKSKHIYSLYGLSVRVQ